MIAEPTASTIFRVVIRSPGNEIHNLILRPEEDSVMTVLTPEPQEYSSSVTLVVTNEASNCSTNPLHSA